MWTEISAAGGFLGLSVLLIKLQNRRVDALEKAWKEQQEEWRQHLYAADGTAKFMPRTTCERQQNRLCKDLNELTAMLRAMDEKREKAKDEVHVNYGLISSRLASIEAKLDQMER